MNGRKPSRRERIEAMRQEVIRRGGIVHLSPDTPEWIAEKFLEEVLACPECSRGSGEHS